ncbi:hypothetical protein PTQ27_10885, partial [Mannheimia sp. AT1]
MQRSQGFSFSFLKNKKIGLKAPKRADRLYFYLVSIIYLVYILFRQPFKPCATRLSKNKNYKNWVKTTKTG